MNYFWGMSEALDLYGEYRQSFKLSCLKPEPREVFKHLPDPMPRENNMNILCFGASDPRHVLKTCAKMYTHRNRVTGNMPSYNLFVLDRDIETFARDLLLMGIAFESPESGISLRHKAHLFMDVYGNTRIRPSTYQYISGKAITLTKMVTDKDYREKVAPILDLDFVKYKELDGVQMCLDYWRSNKDYPISNFWDNRVRHLLGERYDYREGVFDWDFNMVLRDRGAHQLCSQEYRYFRETGIGFTFPEYEQCKPNKTLYLGIPQYGRAYHHWSYQGDTQTGPYCAFGLKTNDSRMTGTMHGENDYRATDITERNLLELFYEIESQSPYRHNLDWSHKYGSVRLQMNPCLGYAEKQKEKVPAYSDPWLFLPGVRIFMLCANEVFALSGMGRWCNMMDVVFIGNDFFPLIDKNAASLLRSNGVLILETRCFSCDSKTQVSEAEAKLKKYCTDAGLVPVMNYNAMNKPQPLLKYVRQGIPDVTVPRTHSSVYHQSCDSSSHYATYTSRYKDLDDTPGPSRNSRRLEKSDYMRPNIVEEPEDEIITDPLVRKSVDGQRMFSSKLSELAREGAANCPFIATANTDFGDKVLLGDQLVKARVGYITKEEIEEEIRSQEKVVCTPFLVEGQTHQEAHLYDPDAIREYLQNSNLHSVSKANELLRNRAMENKDSHRAQLLKYLAPDEPTDVPIEFADDDEDQNEVENALEPRHSYD